MQHEVELAYVGVEVPEPESLDAFFGEVIGLTPAVPAGVADGGRAWRDDDRVQRVVVDRGPANDVSFVGMEVVAGASFDDVAARIRATGAALLEGTAHECARRHVARLAHVDAPWGSVFELVQGLAVDSVPFASALMPGGFLTEGVGFGHVVLATTAFDESHAFLVDGVGMRQSDWLELELAPGIVLEVRFYHCNARHHSIALARAPFALPQTLNHIMFETKSRDDVGAAFDRAWASGLAIPSGLGRHDNDGMFSFYVASPAGFQVEVGHGARVVTDMWDDNRRYDRISAWGHQPLRAS